MKTPVFATFASGTVALLVALSGVQAQPVDALDAALRQFDPQQASRWSYQRAASNGEERTLEQFDPGAADGARWTLIEVDGEIPDSKRQQAYLDKADTRADREHPAAFNPRELIEMPSLELARETDAELQFRFQPRAEPDASEEEADIVAQLRGTLTLAKSPPRLLSMELTNHDTFSPARFVRIKTLRTRFEFAPMGADGPTALRAVQTETEGSYMRLKSFAQQQRIEFRAFEPAAGRAAATVKSAPDSASPGDTATTR